jgi:hypothetical protein
MGDTIDFRIAIISASRSGFLENRSSGFLRMYFLSIFVWLISAHVIGHLLYSTIPRPE